MHDISFGREIYDASFGPGAQENLTLSGSGERIATARKGGDDSLAMRAAFHETATLAEHKDAIPYIETSTSRVELSDLEEQLLAVTTAARAARDQFAAACSTDDESHAELQYYSCRDALEDAWQYASVRSQPFRDLLATVEAAVKTNQLAAFDSTQRDILHVAFIDLCRPFVEQSTVDTSIEKFAEYGIDITGPIMPQSGLKKFRIIIEEVDE